jgi:hypothetical protein
MFNKLETNRQESQMEPDTCPPWWPHIWWWRIHGPHPERAAIDRQIVAKLDSYFAALSIAALSSSLVDKKIGSEIANIVGKIASDPMPALAFK